MKRLYVLMIAQFLALVLYAQRPAELTGEVNLQLATGESMIPMFCTTRNVYRIAGEFISGTRFRIHAKCGKPCYLYVLASDLRNEVNCVFPADKGRANLCRENDSIALPDESTWIELDDTPGTDYLCLLYATEALDVDTVVESIKTLPGSFYQKIKAALDCRMVSEDDVHYVFNHIAFSARTQRSVVPIIIELMHK